MTAMTPGSNIPLSVPRVTVDVAAPVRLDVSGLLLTADGKVRSDDDFVFYNQPPGPGVTYRSGGGTAPDAITVDTAAVPPGIEKIVVTASPDAAGRPSRASSPRPRSATRTTAACSPPSPRRSWARETALVVVEVYRRGGAWKVRAVGQGYANGLAGIATDFGVSVEEPAAAPPPRRRRAPRAAGRPRSTRAGRCRRPPRPPAAAPPPPPAAPGRSTWTRAGSASRRTRRCPWSRAGSRCCPQVKMGLGWEPAFRGKDIDLDASVIAYGPQRNHIGQLLLRQALDPQRRDQALRRQPHRRGRGRRRGDHRRPRPASRRRSPAWSSRSTPSPARSSPRSPRPTAA